MLIGIFKKRFSHDFGLLKPVSSKCCYYSGLSILLLWYYVRGKHIKAAKKQQKVYLMLHDTVKTPPLPPGKIPPAFCINSRCIGMWD